MSEAVIELNEVSFAYGDKRVLHPLSMTVDAEQLVFVVGPNGAGKSTLLRLVAGLEKPATGAVRCLGIDPGAAQRRSVARKLAFLPQSYELAFPFTVAEVVLLGRYAHGRGGLAGFYTRSDDRALAEVAMERCDVHRLRNRRWNQLSGGEQRRALLAQAFCQDAPLLLLDEPTASLDPAHAIDVFDAVEARPSGTTTVVVSHDLNLAARYADRIVVLDEGRMVADGPPQQVLAAAATREAFGVSLHLGQLPGTDIHFVVPG